MRKRPTPTPSQLYDIAHLIGGFQTLVGYCLAALTVADPLPERDRELIAGLLLRLLNTPKALWALDPKRPRGTRSIDRHEDMAIAYLLHIRLGASKREAKNKVANAWKVEPGTVADAITKKRADAERLLEQMTKIISRGKGDVNDVLLPWLTPGKDSKRERPHVTIDYPKISIDWRSDK